MSSGRSARSEATRLLSAGVYLDARFRRQVTDELIGQAHRPAAPSLGVDVRVVLAHALRARRMEWQFAGSLLAVWVGTFLAGILLLAVMDEEPAYADPYAATSLDPTGILALFGALFGALALFWWALVCLLLWAGRRVSRVGRLLRFAGRALGVWYVFGFALFNPLALLLPLALAAVVWHHRRRVVAVLTGELGENAFASHRPPALPFTGRYRRIDAALAREQHAPAVVYDPYLPFLGAGEPYRPWSFAIELKRREERGERGEKDGGGTLVPATRNGQPQEPAGELTSARLLALVRDRLAGLRTPGEPHSRDRLRELEIEEFVYLPAGPDRESGLVFGPEATRAHLEQSLGEGAEVRRHFLRIRVGAWGEDVVVSVLVRFHLQGGMLVLEVVPHVLTPVRADFRLADLLAARPPGVTDGPRDAVAALLDSPTATFAAGVAAVSSMSSAFRMWLRDPDREPPAAPRVSIRELAESGILSLFQQMDASRYVKTVEDRVSTGVLDALRQCGYETGEFEQHVTTVQNGGVYIQGDVTGGAVVGSMSGGAFTTGAGSHMSYSAGPRTAPATGKGGSQ